MRVQIQARSARIYHYRLQELNSPLGVALQYLSEVPKLIPPAILQFSQ
jgi:hypothetical protein